MDRLRRTLSFRSRKKGNAANNNNNNNNHSSTTTTATPAAIKNGNNATTTTTTTTIRVAFPFQLIGWRDELQTRGRKKKRTRSTTFAKASKQHVQESAMKSITQYEKTITKQILKKATKTKEKEMLKYPDNKQTNKQ